MVAPTDWKIIKVGECAQITTGKKNTQDRVTDGHYPFFVRSQNVERINSYSYDGEAVLTAGDGVGTGKVFHYIQGKFDCHQRVYRLTEFRPDLNGKFFFYLFSRLFYDRIMSMTAKSSVDSVRMEMISEMELVVPSSIREQEAIAEALSDADAAIESLEALIAKKRDVKQAAMQQLLTGRTRLPGFTADWEEIRLGDLGSFSKGTGIRKDDVVSSGIPCIRYGQIYTEHNSVIRSVRSFVSAEVASTTKALAVGDVLFAGSGETKADIGKCVAYVDDIGAVAGGDLVILSPKQCNPIFLGYALNSPKVAHQKMARAQGDAVVHISAASLATVVVDLPPLREQEAIGEALGAMDDELEALSEQVKKMRMVKEGMMQDLLTGEVSLV